MNLEIERKFLLKNDEWKQFAISETLYEQGYLHNDKEKTIRARVAGEKAFLTIKGGQKDSFSHLEFEYEIPLAEAKVFLSEFCGNKTISKTRYIVPAKDAKQKWEIDIFHGENEDFEKPEWLGEEVTHDNKYKNARLIENPFKSW